MPIRIVKKSKAKNLFPDIPDPLGKGQAAVDFLCSLKHPKSTLPSKAFRLDPWQEKIVRSIYGPYDDDGNRIVQSVVIVAPRGNHKTSLASALTLLHTIGPEAVPSGEVLFAAADKKQAKIGLAEAAGIIQATYGDMWKKGQAARLASSVTGIRDQSYKNRILFPNGSFLEALSNDADTQHGRTPVFALCDEIHAWKKRELWTVIDTALPKVRNSLRVTITTSGRGQDNLAYDVIADARKIANGEIHEPSTLPILFEAPPDADWHDEKLWYAVNPGMAHGYPDIRGIRIKAGKAERSVADREEFLQFNLCQWLDKSTSPFVDMQIYDQGNAPIDIQALNGKPCWLGVDLGFTEDLSAVVAVFHDPAKEDGYIVLPFYFTPADNLEKRQIKSGFPYVHHVEEGRIVTMPGNITNYHVIEDHIRSLAARYQVREIAIDPHLAQMLMQKLQEHNLPVIQFYQKGAYMKSGIRELERAILAGRFKHGGNPVLRWNFANIAVKQEDDGNRLFSKTKSTEKIDGAVAAAMAVARAAEGNDTRSVYATEKRPEGFLVW